MDRDTVTELLIGDGTAVETIRNLLAIYTLPFPTMWAACVHFLATTPVVTEEGLVRAQWEVTRIVESAPRATEWAEFCRVHLGMDPTTASRYKRKWETFIASAGLTAGEQRDLPASLRRVNAMMHRKSGYVYLFSASGLGFKIGRTIDVGERLQVLIRELNTQIEVVCSGWFDDCVEAEAILHSRFRDKRRSGEWFDLSRLDIDYVWGYLRKR